MADLIPKDTDEEMLRYEEAEMIRRARIPMENNSALAFEADPVTGRENAYFPLSSGGYVKIGDRAVTPAQAATTDALAVASKLQNEQGVAISDIMGGADGPVMDDYLAAGFTEAQVRQYEAQRKADRLKTPGVQIPVQLTPEQIQMGVDVGAPMIAPRDMTMREQATAFASGTGSSDASQFLGQVYEAIGLDQFEARRLAEAVLGNPNATRDWGIGLADLTPAGMVFGTEEGYNTFQRGLQAGDPATAGLGALEAGLSILEAAPLAGAGIKAAITPAMRQAINTLRADAIGAGRAIARGDTEMLGEVFQRGGEPRSLGAAAPDPETAGAITAFHGSPYDFDFFDIGKMGAGQGEQRYGPGLYFSEAENVAKEYRDDLTDRRIPPLNNRMREISNEMNEISTGYRQWKSGQEDRGRALAAEYDDLMEQRSNMRGHLYEVNIRSNPEDFLDFNAPISQQSERVKEVLMPFVEQRISQMLFPNELTTEQWMDHLRGGDILGLEAFSEVPVSRALIDAGIPGVRYLERASRAGREGVRNYVVFDDQLIDIVKKYGVAGLAVGAAVQSDMGIQDQIEDGA